MRGLLFSSIGVWVMVGSGGVGCGGAPPPASPASSAAATGSASSPADRAASTPPVDVAPSTTATASTPSATGTSATPAGKLLTMEEARKYMLELINRDRATQHLAPVTLDESSAQAAGQTHAEDMAKHGYLGHWGTDGSVPEERMTRAGGADFDMENALCFTDEKERKLDGKPMIGAAQVEKSESMFFNEVPPNDGHRKNILKPFHKKVGIGVSQPLSTATEIAVPCFSQEFTDPYGTYAPLPKEVHVGSTLHVSGEIHAPAKFAGVGLSRIETPKPITVAVLNTRRSYPIPQPYQMYWPAGYKTPIVVAVKGEAFSIDVPVSDGGKPGLYEVSVWASVPGAGDLVMVSLRTMMVK